MKTRVAVLFGGRSPEHDVSIVTGLQALQALDQDRYSPFPVYVAVDGRWFWGEDLRHRRTYLPGPAALKALTQVTLDLDPNASGLGKLLPTRGGLFGKPKPIEFDVALLAFHGLYGEDGRVQSLMEIANVPYTGMRTLASTVLMDKSVTKRVLADSGIALLPEALIERPQGSLMVDRKTLEARLGTLTFPLIVKPSHLGSSIGVTRADNLDTLQAALATIFRLDTQAIVEPLISNLVEYNVAVRRDPQGLVRTSAIERPKSEGELLDFKDKYMRGAASGKSGSKGKQPGLISEGMLSLTRELNPAMSTHLEQIVRNWSVQSFEIVFGTGVPRIDFLCDSRTEEIWLNEINPCPGSFGYFLWEAAAQPVLFSELLSSLIDEGFVQQKQIQLPPDPTHPEARLFERRTS